MNNEKLTQDEIVQRFMANYDGLMQSLKDEVQKLSSTLINVFEMLDNQ
jgi:hypothetical protein